jgi:hypothetical protein
MNNIEARMVYENARTALNKAFPGLKGADIASVCKLTQSTYRFEQPLVAGNALYQFPVLVNQELFSNTEKRLLQQDSAVIYQVGIFAGAPASATDAAFIPDTYNSPVKYGANAATLLPLWNGSNLSIAVNNDILVPNWDVMKHFVAPITQQSAALGAGSPQDQFRGGFDGFEAMEPNVVMIGSKNNVIQLNLAVGLATVKEFSRVIVMVRCITAQNSSVVS